MVRKTLILISLTLLAQFAEASTLRMIWLKPHDPKCQTRMGEFLNELKDIASDHVVELEMAESRQPKNTADFKTREILVRCDQNAVIADDHGEPVRVQHLGQNAGFDSLDWLNFQKRFLSFNVEPAQMSMEKLAPEQPKEDAFSAVSKSESESKISKKTVGLTVIGTLAGATGGALFSPNKESVPLNALVFGVIGGIAGAFLGSR